MNPTSVEGAWNLPYALDVQRIGLTSPPAGIPVLWWRAVGSTHTAFAVEAFMDQLAEINGQDPLDYRRSLLKDAPRHSAVLKLAAEKAGWGTPPSDGRVRAIAMAESFSTPVAHVVELSVSAEAITVHKVVCAIDCGIVVNPDTVRAQMEGGI